MNHMATEPWNHWKLLKEKLWLFSYIEYWILLPLCVAMWRASKWPFFVLLDRELLFSSCWHLIRKRWLQQEEFSTWWASAINSNLKTLKSCLLNWQVVGFNSSPKYRCLILNIEHAAKKRKIKKEIAISCCFAICSVKIYVVLISYLSDHSAVKIGNLQSYINIFTYMMSSAQMRVDFILFFSIYFLWTTH